MSCLVLYAGTEKFDKVMHPVLDEYLRIQDALAADKIKSVKAAAEQIVILVDKVDPNIVKCLVAAKLLPMRSILKAHPCIT